MATWNCESCHRGLRAGDGMIGRAMRCPFCEHVQTVPGASHVAVALAPPPPPPAPPPAAPPPAAPPRRRRVPSPAADRIVITNEDLRNVRLLPPTYAGVPPTVAEQRRRAQEVLRHQTTVKPKDWIDEDKCPFCLCDMDPGQHVVVCPECGLAHHADCWEENEGCCTFGCKLAPLRHSLGPPVAAPAQAARTSSMPVIAGDQRRRCSNCGRFLPLGETRCRHCEGRPAFVVPSDAAGRSLVAGRTLGRAIFAICWAVLAMILVLGALPPVAARIPLSLAVIAPGFVAAVSAISRASKISSAVAGDSSTSGQGRAALATVLGVIAVLLSLIAFFGGIARSYG